LSTALTANVLLSVGHDPVGHPPATSGSSFVVNVLMLSRESRRTRLDN
jgi:hypothetical protein